MCRALVFSVLRLSRRNINRITDPYICFRRVTNPPEREPAETRGTEEAVNETRRNGMNESCEAGHRNWTNDGTNGMRSGKDVRAVRKRTSEVRNRTDSWRADFCNLLWI